MQLLTPAQAAKMLNMSVRFVREHAGELGGLRMGGGPTRAGRLRFHENGLLQFIASHTARRPNEAASCAEPKRMAG